MVVVCGNGFIDIDGWKGCILPRCVDRWLAGCVDWMGKKLLIE